MTASIPPGWYDDPSAPGMERWWDGSQWTESSRPRSDSSPGVPPAPGMMADQVPGNFTGQTPTFPPYATYGPAGSGPGPSSGNRNRNLIIGVVSLLVVGGLIAALIVLLGGGDDDKAATAGTLSDPGTGVSIPQLKGWDVPKPSTEPTHQVIGRIPCEDASSGAPSDGPSDDPSGSASLDDCYLGEAYVDTLYGKSFAEAVKDFQSQIEDDGSGYKVLNTETSEPIKVNDKNAHLLAYKVEETEAVGGAKRVFFAQFVIIDAPVDDNEYPMVYAHVYDMPNAPSKAALESIKTGIKVGLPQPSDSAS
ncbi:MAG TPA: DUF2510 domain-containing protein [Yinghuangia sp.]|uniref:DUF2510 domain-containing protein n=1 Tax=Yinghuangia sp. YIM S10712 TaxID=3436930 RepID=UPI002BCBAAC6|nr:DUF2510 domain-containing protein [Yinghuangia sp.]